MKQLKETEQKGVFLPMLLRALTVSSFGSVLTGTGEIRVCEGIVREGENF